MKLIKIWVKLEKAVKIMYLCSILLIKDKIRDDTSLLFNEALKKCYKLILKIKVRFKIYHQIFSKIAKTFIWKFRNEFVIIY